MLLWFTLAAVAAPDPSVEPIYRTETGAALEEAWRWQQLEALRARISDSRAQLQVLRELYPETMSTNSTLSITPSDGLGARYDLITARILIDGEVVHEGLGTWEAEVPSGVHRVQLHARVRGANRGLFTYLNEYEIDVVSTQDIEALPGERTVARPVAVARPGWAYSFAERPAWWWEVEPGAVTP